MVFTSPSAASFKPRDVPDTVSIADFVLDERWGRRPISASQYPFVCGLTGKKYSVQDLKSRTELLATALRSRLRWDPAQRDEWNRVGCMFSLNTVDALIVSWAIQRLNGISSPINAAFSASEVANQLVSSGTKLLFTNRALLPVALKAAAAARLPVEHIYLIEVGKERKSSCNPGDHLTIDQLINEAGKLPKLSKLRWAEAQGAEQTAFLCYSSGTSGLPKGVMISHRNVIANVMQITANETRMRTPKKKSKHALPSTEVVLCALPQSHIYGLVYICHLAVYRGDQIVVLPKYDFVEALACIDRFKINTLFLVPPIIVRMAKEREVCQRYKLTSVISIITGAAPLGAETAEEIGRVYPHWHIRQGYGLTETATVASSTLPPDIWHGSSGMLIPGFEARLIAADGSEVTKYDIPGELQMRSPSVVLGYHNNQAANEEAFTSDGWLKTGDMAMVRISPRGNEHIWIIDRSKDLIKVKGHQVAPAELEAHILTHPNVADCAVIPVPNEAAGELPKAFVVSKTAFKTTTTAHDIERHVQEHKAKFKWLAGGVEFVDEIPKSPTGKILRRVLRDQEELRRRKVGAKL